KRGRSPRGEEDRVAKILLGSHGVGIARVGVIALVDQQDRVRRAGVPRPPVVVCEPGSQVRPFATLVVSAGGRDVYGLIARPEATSSTRARHTRRDGPGLSRNCTTNARCTDRVEGADAPTVSLARAGPFVSLLVMRSSEVSPGIPASTAR